MNELRHQLLEALFDFSDRNNGITDPREPITFPYLTTENLVFLTSIR